MVKRISNSNEITQEALENFYELIEEYHGWVKKNNAKNDNGKKVKIVKHKFEKDDARIEMKNLLDKLADNKKVDFPELLERLVETKAHNRRVRDFRRAKSELMGRTKEDTPGRRWAIRRKKIKAQLDHIFTEIPTLYQDAESNLDADKQKPGYNPRFYMAIRRFDPNNSIENVPLGPKDERVLKTLYAFQKAFKESPLFQGQPRRRSSGHQSEEWIKSTLEDLKKIHVPYYIGNTLLSLIGVKPSLEMKEHQSNRQ